MSTNPSLIKNFYSGSYIRYTNGPHVSNTALITSYEPDNSIISWNQATSNGKTDYISTQSEMGFRFVPESSGVITGITIALTAFDVSSSRNLLLRIRNGINFK